MVLGAATCKYNKKQLHGEVSPVYRERLNHAINLHQQEYVKKIIVTRGYTEDNEHSDAYIAKQYVITKVIPEEDILTEEQSAVT